MSRKLNFRLLLTILGILTVLAASVHLLHGHQTRRFASTTPSGIEPAFETAPPRQPQPQSEAPITPPLIQQQRLALEYVGSLYRRRLFVEASLALRQVEENIALDAALCRLGADIALKNRDFRRAVRLAEQALPAESRDYRDHAWLGRVLAAAGEHGGAEKALRQAVTSGSHSPEAWLALVEHLVRTGRLAQAEAAMQKAVASVAQEAGALLRARGEELLGRVDRAEELYRRACEKRPDDFLVFLQAAEFFRRSDRPAEAEPFLRTVLSPALNAPPELVSRARRLLAIDLAWTAADCRAEAVPLLDANRAGRQHTVSDTLARAAILGAEAKQRPAALRLFDEVLKKHPATSEDLFLLARLLEADGQHSRAREVLLQLQDAEPDCPQYVAAHVRCLIASGDLDDAAVYLGKLELREPRSRRVRELHAALLKARAAVADSQH